MPAPNAGSDMEDEIAAQAWSYAAVVYLRLSPETVFHATGYEGAAAKTLIQIYRDGNAGRPPAPVDGPHRRSQTCGPKSRLRGSSPG